MVGRGSRDPCAQADMRVLSEVVSRRVDIDGVSTAFCAMADPGLPEVLESVASGGHYRTIVVYPHLLFAGQLFERISQQVNRAAEKNPDVEFRLSMYLGPDPLVANAIADRIGQASSHRR
jgi:sirohydrochlorin cobaltochelatase